MGAQPAVRAPIIDLNAASLMDNDPNRIGLIDILRNDGAHESPNAIPPSHSLLVNVS